MEQNLSKWRNTIQDALDKKTTWSKGEKVRFTGKIEYLYGGIFGEVKVLTGHQKNEILLVGIDKEIM